MTEVYSPKIKPEHLARKAIVYLRQSSDKQVRQNKESQLLQYAMAERVRALGWKQVEVINSDLGSSAGIAAAQREGFDDVLLLNPDGTISEIATSNIGFVRNGQAIWPRSEWLTGTTMTLLNQVLDEPIHTEPVTLTDLPAMELVFATNAATGIRPVTSVDDQSWPTDHAALRQLRDLYADIPGEQL